MSGSRIRGRVMTVFHNLARFHEECERRARESSGDRRFDVAHQRGQAREMDTAVACVLREKVADRAPTPSGPTPICSPRSENRYVRGCSTEAAERVLGDADVDRVGHDIEVRRCTTGNPLRSRPVSGSGSCVRPVGDSLVRRLTTTNSRGAATADSCCRCGPRDPNPGAETESADGPGLSRGGTAHWQWAGPL